MDYGKDINKRDRGEGYGFYVFYKYIIEMNKTSKYRIFVGELKMIDVALKSWGFSCCHRKLISFIFKI